MFRQNYFMLVLTSTEKRIRNLAIQPAKISGRFDFSVRSILPRVNKIYLLVCVRRFISDFFGGEGGLGIWHVILCLILCLPISCLETLVVFFPRYATHREKHALRMRHNNCKSG